MTKLILSAAAFLLLTSPPLSAQTEAEPAETVAVEVQICSAIEERMPVDTVDVFPAGTKQVYAWCRVTGAVDSVSIWVDWYYGDELKGEVELPVKSSSWRTWSSKKLLPEWTGEWEVRVLDAERSVLRSVSFFVGKKSVPDNK